MDQHILNSVLEEMQNSSFVGEKDKEFFKKRLEQLKQQQLNIMFVGATGVGKSSTINALFNAEIAKIGYSTEPETDAIRKYELDNLVLWDTPGLGDNPQKDKIYASQIVSALKQKDGEGNLLIDEVVVLVNGSSRDMRTTYEIIESIVAPYIGDTERIVIAINQCDMALSGKYWSYDAKHPEIQLQMFLEEKIISVKDRVTESTGITVLPIYYSALYHYNISKLLLTMMKSIPDSKRFLFTDSLNKEPDIWKKNDQLEHYNDEIQHEIQGSLTKALDGAAKGAVAGATVGGLIPVIGPVIGAAVGAALGFFGGFID